MSQQTNLVHNGISITSKAEMAARRAADERAADEQFVAWVLGYGYAAGHLQSLRRSEAGATLRVAEPVLA